jgi:hypothetical protein
VVKICPFDGFDKLRAGNIWNPFALACGYRRFEILPKKLPVEALNLRVARISFFAS